MLYKAVFLPTRYEYDKNGTLHFRDGSPLLSFVIQTVTTSDIEVFYELTDPRGQYLKEAEKKLPDGYYRLLLYRESLAARMAGKRAFAFQSWHLLRKTRDFLLWENKYPVVGYMNKENQQPRDIQDEVKRKNWKYVPGTLDKMKGEEDIDSVSTRIYSYGN